MSTNALEIAQKLITFPSGTPTHPDATPEHSAACSATLDYIQQITAKATNTSRRYRFNGGDDLYPHEIDNLWLRYILNFGERLPRHLLILAHIDVVPVDKKAWTVLPYEGVVKDGRLYGRGATDMKGPLASCVAALNCLMVSRRQEDYFQTDVLITSDEEYAALNGIRRLLKHLKDEYDVKYDAVLILEPSSPGRVGKVIATGRRGSLNGKVVVKGKKGHRAYPNSYRNPVPVLAEAIIALENLSFETSPDWMASTDLEVRDLKTDSDSTSVIASTATASWNIRYTGNYTPAQLRQMVEDAVNHLSDDAFEVTVEVSNYPKNPYLSKPGDGKPELLDAFQSYLMDTYGEPAELTNEGGMSDGCHVEDILGPIEIIEVGPDTTPMHQNDESIAVNDLEELKTMFQTVIPRYCQQGMTFRKVVPYSESEMAETA